MSVGPKPRAQSLARPRPRAIAARWLPIALASTSILASLALDGCNKVIPPTLGCVEPVGANVAGGIVKMVGLPGTSTDGGNTVGDGKCARETDLFWPSSMVFGADSTVYFTDLNNLRVRHVRKDGTLETVAGGGSYGTISGAPKDWYLFHPSGLLRDATGNMYIGLWHGNIITKLTPAGTMTIIAGATERGGSEADGVPATEADLREPREMAWDAQGNLYVAESASNRVRMINMTTGLIHTVAGTGVAGFAGDDGDPLQAQLDTPYGIAIASDGSLYIADTGNNRIRKVDPQRTTITTIAGDGASFFSGDGGPSTLAELDHPQDLRFGPDGSLFVADTFNHCVRRIQWTQGVGVMTTVAGVGRHAGYSGDGGAARAAHLDNPDGLAFDPQGNLWIADTYNQRIRRIHVPF